MDVRQESEKKTFELISKKGKGNNLLLNKRRILVGSSEACDVIISARDVSGIHAVIESSSTGFKIFDMNSTNGTFINGSRKVVAAFKLGDKIKFGAQEFVFKEYSKADMAPVLDMLAPDSPSKIQARKYKSLPASPEDVILSDMEFEVPRVEYPLAKDPKAEFSEYIFEDVETLYPIFNYTVDSSAIEVIILFKGDIYSVDYLPNRKQVYKMVGSRASNKQVEFAQLAKSEKVSFIEVKKDEVIVHPINGYSPMLWTDESDTILNDGPVNLYPNDILKLEREDLQIFVRLTSAPPRVASAPIFRKDKEFKKYLLLMFLLVFSFLTAMTLFEVDTDLEEDKAPERIATILYKKQFTVNNVKKVVKKIAKKVKQTVNITPKEVTKTQKKIPKNINKVKTKSKAVNNNGNKKAITKKLVKKVRPNKGKVSTRKINVVRPKILKGAGSKRTIVKASRVSRTKRKSKGRVDSYKSFDFKSTMSNLLSKSGNTKSYKAATTGRTNSFNTGANSVGGRSARLKGAKVTNRLGNLTGATNGKVDSSRGVRGILRKKSQYFAGLPYKTITLGGMDPNIIRRILMEYIPQFRSCYQKVLGDGIHGNFQGVVKLDFIIGASGHVSRAGIEVADNAIPAKVKTCVIDTLKGIPFPAPPGGGVIEVSQGINFYPSQR
jgi:hypothetical protein